MDAAALSTSLFLAIIGGNLAGCVSLVKTPGIMQITNSRGNTPLMEAIVTGQQKVNYFDRSRHCVKTLLFW